jgi:hypothetical protein
VRVLACCCSLLSIPLLCPAAGPAPSASPVTVLLNYEQPYSRPSFEALQRQLQHVLAEVGVRLDVRQRSETTPHEEFSELLLFEMKGSCSMAPVPVDALSDERGALAMAYSADGTVLPFGAVQCDRIRESLERIVGRGAPERYQQAFGAALGLVMAHEIYHMLAHSGHHTRQGVTKESLSARELLDSNLPLPDVARLAMRQSLFPRR